MRNANDIHTALILFTAEAYLAESFKDGLTGEDWHRKIVSAINAWKTFRRFSSEELALIQEISKDEVMERIKQTEISFVVYALVLLQLLANDPMKRNVTLSVSKKKLRVGDSVFVVPMLKQKRADLEKYESLKNIIAESRINAKHFYYYTYEKLEERI